MRGVRRWSRGLALLALVIAASVEAEALAPRPGSRLWLQAEMLSWELPGALPPSAEERALIAEALAAPGLEDGADALEQGRSPAPALGALVHGEAAALSRREAVALLAGLRAPSGKDKDLPKPVDRKGAQAFARKEGEVAEAALARGVDPKRIRAWMQEVAARAAAAPPGDGLPDAVRQVTTPARLVRALEGEEEARLDAWGEFRTLAWARRAIRRGLRRRIEAAQDRAAAVLRGGKVAVVVRVLPGPGESPGGLVVSLAGGRLGTETTGPKGGARLEVGLGDLARVARGQGVVALQIVQQRREVLRRELPVEVFLEAGRELDLGELDLAPARGRLLVEVPGWERLLAGQVEDSLPVKAIVRVGGAMRPEPLGRDGRAVVPSLAPGLHLVSLAGQDEAGSVVQRAFGVVEVPAGGEVVCTLRLPIEDVAEPIPRKRVAQVREDLAGLAARYKGGRIPRGAFRRTVGAIYRLHREVTGDPKKDEAFSREVRVAMQAAFQSVLPEAAAGGDPGPALGDLERQLAELGALLPEFLRGDRPAGRLDEYLQVEIGGAFAGQGEGFRSIRHREADLRRARAAAEEVAGIRELLTGVVGPRLEKLAAALRKQAEAYRDGYTHFHLAGLDYEERFLKLAGSELSPLRELVRRAHQLVRARLVEDLRARVEAEEAAVAAARARLATQGQRWEALRDRLTELRRRLTVQAAGPPELPWGGEALVARAARGELSGIQAVREVQPDSGVVEALAAAGKVVAKRSEVARLHARAAALREVLDGRLRAELVAAFERRAEESVLDELARLAPTDRRKALAQHTAGLYEELAAPPLEVPAWVTENPAAGRHLRRSVLARDAERRAREQFLAERAEELDAHEASEPPPTLEDLTAWRGRAKAAAPSASWVEDGLSKVLAERWEVLAAAARERASVEATAPATGAP